MNSKNQIRNILVKVVSIINSLSLLLAVHTANVACGWLFYQDKEPEEVKKMRKF